MGSWKVIMMEKATLDEPPLEGLYNNFTLEDYGT
jgi:hypothetical protein